jgi:hypothetical protein
VLKKNICDGVGGQDESNGTPLYPPLFWLDNIFKQMPLKKARAKKDANIEYFRFCAFFRGFLLLTFVRGISEQRI